METKAIHVLLLSAIMITGVMSIGNAYAQQTNTDRLVNILDNSDTTNSLLTALTNTITEAFTGFSAALDGLAASIASLNSAVNSVNESVSMVSDEVAAVDEKVTMVSSDIQMLKDDIEEASTAASMIRSDVQNTISSISVPDYESELRAISDGIGSTSAQISGLEDSVMAISKQLESMTASDVMDAEMTDVMDAEMMTPSSLYQNSVEFKGMALNFAASQYPAGIEGMDITVHNEFDNDNDDFDYPEEYKLEFEFSCSDDVYVSVVNFIRNDAIDELTHGDLRSVGTVNPKVPISEYLEGNTQPIDRPKIDRNYERLSNDQSIQFEAVVEESDADLSATNRVTSRILHNFTNANFTAIDNGPNVEFFSLTANWLSLSDDTKCEFDITSNSPPAADSKQFLIAIEDDSGDDTIVVNFDRTLTCTNSEEITDIVVQVRNTPFYNVVTLEIKDSDDDVYEIDMVDLITSASDLEIPIESDGINATSVNISGSMPRGAALLIEATVIGKVAEPTVSCSIAPTP